MPQIPWMVRWLVIAATAFSLSLAGRPVKAASINPFEDPIPLLAYYYIWFDRGSWDRAKSDYPQLGRYSSDDENVMRQHIAWAQQVGIDGFIVSWKSTDQLNRRLEALIAIAEETGFELAIIYQGLDFERDPLPITRISEDLTYFTEKYADSEAFALFKSPLVIWSGTWEFTLEEISQVTDDHRDRLLILGSEREVESYLEIAQAVDGNAYYWSSVDPDRFPGYQEKLDLIGEAVHKNNGLWISPAAPGFDARLIEGSRVIERKDGETLIQELNSAYASSPDAVGLISWNEFSENTHIEPSVNYGMQALDVISQYNQLPPPELIEFDSSEPQGVVQDLNFGRIISFSIIGVLLLTSLFVIFRRGFKSGQSSS